MNKNTVNYHSKFTSKYHRRESFHEIKNTLSNGQTVETRQFQQVWEVDAPRAAVLVTHGHGEHSDSYNRLIEGLAGLNFSFMSYDLRGHGRSSGRRGYVAEFGEYVSDMEFAYSVFSKKYADLPRFCLGHSMGGMIQTMFFIKNPEAQNQLLAQVLSSPFFELAMSVPMWKKMGSEYIHKLIPKLTLYNEIANEQLTHDKDVIREYERDTLRHTRVSSGAFLGFLENFKTIAENHDVIKLPTLLQIPESDPVVSSNVSREWFRHLANPKNELFVYPHAFHELYNEVMRATVYADLSHFLESILKGKTS